jgi:hypothetical protein
LHWLFRDFVRPQRIAEEALRCVRDTRRVLALTATDPTQCIML